MNSKLLFIAVCILFIAVSFAQNKPQISFEELIVRAEENPQFMIDARSLAAQYDIPHTIYLPEGKFIQALGIENDKVVYAIYNNMIDIYDNGETVYWTDIANEYDLTKARVHTANKPTLNPTLGFPTPGINNSGFAEQMLMVPDWTNDGVATLNNVTGDLISASFIVDATNLSSPKEANLLPGETLLFPIRLMTE